jgi:hypothetical protein
MDEPRYGYGKGQRPLCSPRDRDAEVIRRVLRRAGFRDFDERHLDGFAVEGASSGDNEPFAVAYCGETDGPTTLVRYQRVLQRAGLRVSTDPKDDETLLVQRRSVWSAQPVPRPARTLLSAAVVCAVLATVALIASWLGDGQVRLAGGVGSGVLGAAAAFLAGLWYRRRLDEEHA